MIWPKRFPALNRQIQMAFETVGPKLGLDGTLGGDASRHERFLVGGHLVHSWTQPLAGAQRAAYFTVLNDAGETVVAPTRRSAIDAGPPAFEGVCGVADTPQGFSLLFGGAFAGATGRPLFGAVAVRFDGVASALRHSCGPSETFIATPINFTSTSQSVFALAVGPDDFGAVRVQVPFVGRYTPRGEAVTSGSRESIHIDGATLATASGFLTVCQHRGGDLFGLRMNTDGAPIGDVFLIHEAGFEGPNAFSLRSADIGLEELSDGRIAVTCTERVAQGNWRAFVTVLEADGSTAIERMRLAGPAGAEMFA